MNRVALYYDGMSQPSRAVHWFCLLNEIPLDIHPTWVSKGQTRTEEYAKINPNMKVPAIVHNGLCVWESHSIMRYLAHAFNKPGHWYSLKDLVQRTKVNMYLDWHYNLRLSATPYVFNKVLANKRGKECDEYKLKEASGLLEQALTTMDNYFLKNTKFIMVDEISIADLSAYSEIMHLKLTDYDLSRYRNIVGWMKEMKHVNYHDQAFETFEKIRKKFLDERMINEPKANAVL